MSSIWQTNSALASGGITQEEFNQGLSSFFLKLVAHFHKKRSLDIPIPPSDLPTTVMSNGYIPLVGCCKQSTLNGLRLLHPAFATSMNAGDAVSGHCLSFLPQISAGYAQWFWC